MQSFSQSFPRVCAAATLLLLQACGSRSGAEPPAAASDTDGGITESEAEPDPCAAPALEAALEAAEEDDTLRPEVEAMFCREVSSSSCSVTRVGQEITGSEQHAEWERFCTSRTGPSIEPVSPTDNQPQNLPVVRDGLDCQASGRGFIEVHYRERARTGALTEVSVSGTNLTVVNPEVVTADTFVGDATLAVSIDDTNKDAEFMLTGLTEVASTRQTCSVVIPALSR